MIKRIVIFTLLLLGVLKWATAQDPQFSQFMHAQVYLNPALTAETRQWRVSMNSRMQWMATPAKYVSHALTAEYNAAANHSGLGLQFLHDQAGTGKLTYVSLGGLYSYKARVSRFVKLSFGVKASYNQRYFDRSQLEFSSDLVGNTDDDLTDLFDDRVSYFDLGAGVALVSRRWWAGIAFDHIPQPNYSFSNQNTRLALKYSAHMMYEFVVKRDRKKRVVRSVVAGFNYKGQLEWDQFELGGYYKYHSFSLGLFYRGLPIQRTVPDNFNHDAVVALAGFRWQGLSINYSYDITVSKVWADTGGSHEFSLIVEYPFNPKKRSRSHRLLPCPKF